jgi:hypothetical protein
MALAAFLGGIVFQREGGGIVLFCLEPERLMPESRKIAAILVADCRRQPVLCDDEQRRQRKCILGAAESPGRMVAFPGKSFRLDANAAGANHDHRRYRFIPQTTFSGGVIPVSGQ